MRGVGFSVEQLVQVEWSTIVIQQTIVRVDEEARRARLRTVAEANDSSFMGKIQMRVRGVGLSIEIIVSADTVFDGADGSESNAQDDPVGFDQR